MYFADDPSCTFGSKETGFVSDQDNVIFSSSIGGTPNPMNFTFRTWPSVSSSLFVIVKSIL